MLPLARGRRRAALLGAEPLGHAASSSRPRCGPSSSSRCATTRCRATASGTARSCSAGAPTRIPRDCTWRELGRRAPAASVETLTQLDGARRLRRRQRGCVAGSTGRGSAVEPERGEARPSETARRHIPRIGSPTSATRARIVSTRERGRIDVGDLVPAKRRRDARVGGRAHRVGAGDRPVAGVLAEVDEDALAVGDPPGRRRDPLVADPPLDLLGERLREAAHLGERQLGPDRREDVQPGRPGGLRDTRRGRARPSPRARRARSAARAATARRRSGRGRSAGSRAARSRAARECQVCSSMQPRFATQASAGGVVDRRRRRSSGRSGTTPAPRRRRAGCVAGTRFWWKNSPSTPFG